MKLSSFFVLAKVGFSADLAEFDARCPDLELGQQCDTECSEVFVDCRNNCSDHLCENQCLIEFTECVSDCPCGQNCPNGCQDCDNPLCTTCDNLETDFEFQQCKVIALEEFDHCAMNCLNNWGCIDNCYNREILQGFSQCKCFDEIPSKSTEYLTILSEHENYSGSSYNLGYVTHVNGVYSGFVNSPYTWTQLFDGTKTILSNYNTDADHEGGCMAHLNNQPVAIGGDGGRYVELLRSNGWTHLDPHPMENNYYAGCLGFGQDMVTIGGYGGSSRVYKYSGQSGTWSLLGYLQQAHMYNTVIELNGYIYSTGTTYWRRKNKNEKSADAGEDDSDDSRRYYTTVSPQGDAGIERIQIFNSSISSEIISLHESYGHYRPVLFPTGQFDCSTPVSNRTENST
ncbi:Oidioi.mRNA.OKI2018_I69.XSR.g16638.t1.cds [Oikopleura dioica]|uniref:Oidioi.mRNA.OKI2018_I69.XSR.g16638.t1.cds n=1 Tax=Oikopleura dioica TaxID=34765 RepID=A0ABN7SHA0_OIKDI|nr:Oidioi.mRNA.OKI2018_I69.XSR.g16638.t1.cds [Oikopleura dioica]